MQIKDLLVERMNSREWTPGDIIPSEMQLARELDVSQGTVRKAITELVEQNVLVRRQGRGTFVATHDDNRALFHFFHIVNDNGAKALPDCQTLSSRRKRATRKEALRLGIDAGDKVLSIERVRHLDGQPAIVETVVLPIKLFSSLEDSPIGALPNTLYEMYENQFGIMIHRAEEKLRAVSASPREAKLLNVDAGDPLLEIERLALTLDGTPVELRISRCDTVNYHYHNSVL